jgi:hypothetical protein
MEQLDELVRETRALRQTIIAIAVIAALAVIVVLWAAPAAQRKADYQKCAQREVKRPYGGNLAACDRYR